jgi:flavin-dependent dehydrogenase
VLIVDRERFPRDVPCNGILSAAAQAHLSSIELDDGPVAHAAVVREIAITTARTRLARHDAEPCARVVVRRDFDAWLLEHAIRAGAHFESGVTVTAPLVDTSRPGGLVRGAVLRSGSSAETRMPATLVIAADGARSALADALRLSHASSRRQWAAVVRARDARSTTDCLDVHIGPSSRLFSRLFVAPLVDRDCTIGLVTARDLAGTAPRDAIRAAMTGARMTVDVPDIASAEDIGVIDLPMTRTRAAGVPGLLLIGDAAGVGDMPLLDGVARAIAGAQLAVTHGLRALETGDFDTALGRLADDRRRAFGRVSFGDRIGRVLGSTPGMIDVAGALARVVPAIERAVVDGVLRADRRV